MYTYHHVWAFWTCGLWKIKPLRNDPGGFAAALPVQSSVQCQLKMKLFCGPWVLTDGLTGSLLRSHKNELCQTPDVLTGCWDALIFTLWEKTMSLLLHTSVLKQKARWDFVQNRAFQFYLAFKLCYVWVIVKKIKFHLAGMYLDMGNHSGQVTGRKQVWLLPRRCK